MQGRVVGVNTAIFTNTGTSAGVGFAIPIDIVRSIVPQLIQYGKVVRPALNIQVTPPPSFPYSSPPSPILRTRLSGVQLRPATRIPATGNLMVTVFVTLI